MASCTFLFTFLSLKQNKKSMRVNNLPYSYMLHNQTLEQIASAKYMGIIITDILDRGQHVSDISAKATQTLGFLCRNLAKLRTFIKHWSA